MSAPAKFQRTRFAPTPSGYLHVGNLLSFIITADLAEKTGARILLRIDDMDEVRVRDEYLQDIFDTLHFFQIHWHEGPRDLVDFKNNWSQHLRIDEYNKALSLLEDKNLLFACRCSRKQLSIEKMFCTCETQKIPLSEPECSWKIKTHKGESFKFYTNKGVQEFPFPPAMQNFTVRRKDGKPAYQVCSVVDDLLFKTELVVRGEDLLPSTVAQLYLAQQLDQKSFSEIRFEHHGLIKDQEGRKLSKSAGAAALREARQHGNDAFTVLNKLCAGFKIENYVGG